MNRYHDGTPRITFAIAAIAATAITLALAVAPIATDATRAPAAMLIAANAVAAASDLSSVPGIAYAGRSASVQVR